MEVRQLFRIATMATLYTISVTNGKDTPPVPKNTYNSPYLSTKYNPPPDEGYIFAAVAHMQAIVKLEDEMLTRLKRYSKEQRLKLRELELFAESVRRARAISDRHDVHYLENPINSYLLIKRFVSGWKELANRTSESDQTIQGILKLYTDKKGDVNEFPSAHVDIPGAMDAIIRLMYSYKLTARQVSDGDFGRGMPRSSFTLPVNTLLKLAERTYIKKNYDIMLEFAKEIDRVMLDPVLRAARGKYTTMLQYHQYAAWWHYLDGNIKRTLWHTDEILKEDANNVDAWANKRIYEGMLARGGCDKKECRYVQDAINIQHKWRYTQYLNACRGEIEHQGVEDINQLVSFYKNKPAIFLLKPLKVTRIHDNPEVLIFKKLFDDDVTNKLRKLATPNLRLAQVINSRTSEIETADYRISKSTWLRGNTREEWELMKTLEKISDEAVGLDGKYSENFQPQNYGLGGEYMYHKDCGGPGTYLADNPDGNRIATLLISLSDVRWGGATTFTKLGINIHPRKGDAIFWYNLHRNATCNDRTEHAGCPVLMGSKYVVNRWYRMRGNEFIRPCTLNRWE